MSVAPRKSSRRSDCDEKTGYCLCAAGSFHSVRGSVKQSTTAVSTPVGTLFCYQQTAFTFLRRHLLQEEYPPPTPMQRNPTPKQRPTNQTQRQSNIYHSHIRRQFPPRHNLHEQQLHQREHAAAADALTPPEHDELCEGLCCAAEGGEEREDEQGGYDSVFAADDVGGFGPYHL